MSTYYVSTLGLDTNNGSDTTPFPTLGKAITEANNGDTIYISPGTYDYSGSNNVINIDKELTIIGRENSTDTRPTININTNSNGNAVLCNASNITLKGLEFIHNLTTVGFNDTCISIAPGGTSIQPDNGIIENENIKILDCKIHFTKFCVSSKAKYFSVQNCEFVSKAATTARSIAIYSQDGTIDITDNTFTTSVSNEKIELLHNNFATNDGYQNRRNGTVNFTGNSTVDIVISRRAIFFEVGSDTGLEGDTYNFNVSDNTISTTSDSMFLLQPDKSNFLDFIGLITLNNNTFNNVPSGSNNGLVRVASYVLSNDLVVPTNNPKFLIYSNTIQNTTLNLSSNPYNVNGENVLIFTGFSANSDGDNIGDLTTTQIDGILSSDGGESNPQWSNSQINIVIEGLSTNQSSNYTYILSETDVSAIERPFSDLSFTLISKGDNSGNYNVGVSGNEIIVSETARLNYDSTFIIRATDGSGNSGDKEINLLVRYTDLPIPCFLKGTLILTKYGYKKVEKLTCKDILKTHDNREIEIKSIQCFQPKEISKKTLPYIIPKGVKMNNHIAIHDLYLSPDHAIFEGNNFIEIKHTNMKQIKDINREQMIYYHITTPNFFSDTIIACGIPTESYGGNILKKIESSIELGFIKYITNKVNNNGVRKYISHKEYIREKLIFRRRYMSNKK